MSSDKISGDEEFIIRKPIPKRLKRPFSKGGAPPEIIPEGYTGEDEQRIKEDINSQISSTLSEIKEKPLHDEDRIFFRIDLAINPSHPNTQATLKAISADILAFLNEKQTHLLVSADPAQLSNFTSNALTRKTLRLVRPLRPSDQISTKEKHKVSHELEPFLIHIVPNVSEEKKREYISKIKNYLERLRCRLADNPLTNEGIIPVNANLSQIETLLINSNFILSAELSPKGTIEKVRKGTVKKNQGLSIDEQKFQ